MVNLFNIQEILVFFRYKTFPIFLSLIFLSSFVYAYWAYFQTKKKFFFHLSIAGGLLFVKEFILFLTTRRLLVDMSLPRIEFSFFQWASIELLFSFFAVVAIAAAFCSFSLDKSFNYINTTSVRKELRIYFLKYTVVTIGFIAVVFLLREAKIIDLIILLPAMMTFHLIVLRGRLAWLQKNFIQFSIPGFSSKSQAFFNYFIFTQLLVFLLFVVAAFFFTPLTPQIFFNEVQQADIYSLLDVWIHPIKAVSFAFLAAGFFTVVRNEQMALSEKIENKKRLQEGLVMFEKSLETRMIDLAPPEEVFEEMISLLTKNISAEIFFVRLSHINRVLYSYSHGSAFWGGEQVQPDSLPYMEEIFRSGKNIVVDDFANLSPRVRKHFSFLPVFHKKEVDVAKIMEAKQDLYRKKMQQVKEFGVELPEEMRSMEEKAALEKALAEGEQEHTIRNIIFSKVGNSQKVSLSIAVVNKSGENKEHWKEINKFDFIQVLSDVVLGHWHYFLYYSQYQKMKMQEAGNKVVQEMEKVVQDIDKLHTGNKWVDHSNSLLDIAWGRVYPQRSLRSLIRVIDCGNHHKIAAFDIVGNVQWTFLFHAILQTMFGKIAENSKTSNELLVELSEILKEYKSDSFVNALAISFYNDTKTISYSNSSYLPLLIYKAANEQIISYDIEGLPLGVPEPSEYKNENIALESGDIIVIQSEKLLDETGKGSEEKFYVGDLLEIIKNNVEKSSEEIVKSIIEKVYAIAGKSGVVRDAKMIGIIKVL